MMRYLFTRLPRVTMAALTLTFVAGCAVNARIGNNFDPTVLGRTLKPGSATQADVLAALGKPVAKGGALMPFQERPHLTWTYFFENGTASGGSGKMKERLKYLFVFFAGNKMDGYLWFDSRLE